MEQIVTKIEELSEGVGWSISMGNRHLRFTVRKCAGTALQREKRLRRKTLNSSAQSFWIKGLSSVQCICYRQRTIQKRTDRKTAKGLLSTGIC